MADIIEQTISHIFNLRKLVSESIEKQSLDTQCSFLQLKTLHFVLERKNPTMRDVSVFLGITPPSATSIINRLIVARNIKRIPDKADRRIIRLSITLSGQKSFESGMKNVSQAMRKILSKLGDQEQIQLNLLLKKIVGVNN